MSKVKHKLGVIVPYRGRHLQLLEFKGSIREYLNAQGVDFELIIVEQMGDKTFNRGKLLNVGFIAAKKFNCDYVVFHDIDMIPVDVDYSYSDIPLHLATNFIPKNINRIVFDEYFGGVTLFPVETFEKINGYSNEYWGWGYEDNDLLYRCKIKRIDLDKKEFKIMGGNTAALKFDGTSYVKSQNVVNLNNPLTIFLSFYPDDILCDHTKYDDTYTVLSIPNFNLSISYNSYQRYNFVTYNTSGEVIYISSNIKPNYKTNICVTIDPSTKSITMYQDGVFAGETVYSEDIFNEKVDDSMYLGVGDPNDPKDKKYYRGLINEVSMFDKLLPEREIIELSNNQFFGLTHNFGKYKSSDSLIMSYDAKFIKNDKLVDLSRNENEGEIIGCKIVGYTFDGTKTLYIPHRRESTFKLLPHEENGFVNGAWKDITTRYNQLKYHNEVSRGVLNTQKDGLSNCEYKQLYDAHIEAETHILVSI